MTVAQLISRLVAECGDELNETVSFEAEVPEGETEAEFSDCDIRSGSFKSVRIILK